MPGTTQALSKTTQDTSQALSSSLWTAFISTDPGNAVLVCSSSDGGTNWASNTNTGHSSSAAPSLAYFNGTLYCAYVGADDTNVYVTSTADGVNWSGKTPTGHSSSAAPSLAALSSQLYCAYVGADDTNVYVTSTADGVNWSAKTPTGQSSPFAPSLTVFNGTLYCAYVASNGTDNVYVTSYDPAAGWGDNTNTGQSSPFAPSLAAYSGRLYCAFISTDPGNAVLVCSSNDGVNWTSNTATGQSSPLAPSLAAPPTPLIFRTVVNSGAMLNVGDANLPGISYYMLFNQNGNSGGLIASYLEQGSWGSLNPPGCSNPVTVTAQIDANWSGGSNSVGSWTWQDLRQAFADAVGAAMQKLSDPTAYQNYSYTLAFGGIDAPDICVDPQPSDWGHYIPAGIEITAYNNAPENTGSQAAKVTLTYSTGDQSGGSPCGIIQALGNELQIFTETSPLGALVGAVASLACS